MDSSISDALAEFRTLTVGQLRERYAEVLGETTRVSHRDWLIRRIAWRLQAQAEGDLSERARLRAAELASEADLRLRPSRQADGRADAQGPQRSRVTRPLKPGTIITRRYKGQTLEVRVLLKGFEFRGCVYSSLTAVARAATGDHWSGYRFFRLKETP